MCLCCVVGVFFLATFLFSSNNTAVSAARVLPSVVGWNQWVQNHAQCYLLYVYIADLPCAVVYRIQCRVRGLCSIFWFSSRSIRPAAPPLLHLPPTTIHQLFYCARLWCTCVYVQCKIPGSFHCENLRTAQRVVSSSSIANRADYLCYAPPRVSAAAARVHCVILPGIAVTTQQQQQQQKSFSGCYSLASAAADALHNIIVWILSALHAHPTTLSRRRCGPLESCGPVERSVTYRYQVHDQDIAQGLQCISFFLWSRVNKNINTLSIPPTKQHHPKYIIYTQP